MTRLENQSTPTLAQMWMCIDTILGPIGMSPDKASLDNMQVFKLYSKLMKIDKSFRDTIQAHILRNELAYSRLENFLN